MGIRPNRRSLGTTHVFAIAAMLFAPWAFAGNSGFADKPGGGYNDPQLKLACSIAPNVGASLTMTEDTANELYQFNLGAGTFNLNTGAAGGFTPATIPAMPQNANGANQFIRIKFPFDISKGKARNSIMRNKAALAGTSFLTHNVQITDEAGQHVKGIAVINGRTVTGQKVTGGGVVGFPTWLDADGKNLLIGKNVFAYIADDGDQDLSTIAAFDEDGGPAGTNSHKEIRIAIDKINGITINGFWVIKVADAGGALVGPVTPVTLLSITARSPVSPPKTTSTGLEVIESFSRFQVNFSEPVVPESVGFNARQVSRFNADNPPIPFSYNGNTGPVPNPDNVAEPYFPNFKLNGSPNGTTTFIIPFDVRPQNPNNFSQYVINPLLTLPGKTDITLQALPVSTNSRVDPLGNTIRSAATSFYNIRFDDTTDANKKSFHTRSGVGFTNVPVSPEVFYYAPLSGGGIGAINLDGNGFETNLASTDKSIIFSTFEIVCNCLGSSFIPGSSALGCNRNYWGDRNGAPLTAPIPAPVDPVGVGGTQFGGPATPIPGVNEGSTGTKANDGNVNNPLSRFPPGFETICRNSDGDARLIAQPLIGQVSDMQIGDFMDKLYFDTLNPHAVLGFHQSLVSGGPISSNSISDPPVPNPPPLRLPVGLQPLDIVFNQQKLLDPAFVIEGEEVFGANVNANCQTCVVAMMINDKSRVLLLPNPYNNLAGDIFPTFPHDGPTYQTYQCGAALYAARQQIGNFLYAADPNEGVVKVINSNNFTVLDKIKTPDPEGLGLAPDLKKLYVSNFGDDTLSIVGTDPFAPFFHEEINRVRVGSGPKAVSVQPDGEDVLVCNYLDNTLSILNPNTQTVRKTINDASIKRPWDVVVTPRLQNLGQGWIPGVYFAFIASQGNGRIPIYESGPTGAAGIGADAIRWSVSFPQPVTDMRGMIYDLGTPTGQAAGLAGGVYVPHRDPQTGFAMVDRVYFTAQLPGAGAFPPVPLPSTVLNAPGVVQRHFEVVAQWGGPLSLLNPGGQDQIPYDLCMSDIRAKEFHSLQPTLGVITNIGVLGGGSVASGIFNTKSPFTPVSATVFPDRLYATFPGDNRIVVLDPDSSNVLNRIENVPVPGIVSNWFEQ